jgi:hypothetical protein
VGLRFTMIRSDVGLGISPGAATSVALQVGRVHTWLKQHKRLREHPSNPLPKFFTASRSQTIIDGLRIRTRREREHGSKNRQHIHVHI